MKPDNRRHGFLLRQVLLSLVLVIGMFGLSMKSFGGVGAEKKYAVQVASFRTVEKAEDEAERFRKAGFETCWRVVDLGKKGIWRRVYAGCSDTVREAKDRMGEIKQRKMAKYARVVKLPAAAPSDAAMPAERKSPVAERPPDKETVSVPDVNGTVTIPGADVPAKAPPGPVGLRTEEPPEETAPAHVISTPDVPPSSLRDAEDDSLPVPPVPGPVAQGGQGDTVSVQEQAREEVPQADECRETLPVLKRMAAESLPGMPGRERLFLSCADCAWRLGMEGNSLMLLEAVDHYRQVLRIDPRAGGREDEVRYRIARSYEMLDFFHEAQGSYANLLTLCPASPHAPEALFKVGRMLFKGGKYQEALDVFVSYLKKYPRGVWAKEAYFAAGTACLRLGKPYHAEIWFQDGMKMWSRYDDIPEEILFALGDHFAQRKKYDNALAVLTEYVSLHPRGRGIGEALYRLGMVLYEKGQPERAAFLFGGVLERNPKSDASEESLLMLARIGWENPGLKISLILKGKEALFDPIGALNRVYERHTSDLLGEKALFYKALCLERKERWEEMVETCLAVQNSWGSGKYRNNVLAMLRSGADRLVGKYSGEGDDVAVASLFFRIYGKGLVLPAGFATCRKIGESLQKIGDSKEALKVFEMALTMAGNEEDRFSALSAMVDLDCLEGGADRALERLGPFLAEGEKGKNTVFASRIREKMAGVCFSKGDREKALFLLRPLLQEPSWKPVEPVATHFLLGRAFQQEGNWDEAATHYGRVLQACADGGECDGNRIRQVMRDRGECLYRARDYKEGLLSYEEAMKEETVKDRKLWALYRIGQGHAYSGEQGKSQRILSELKEAGEEEFWTRLADWWLYDHNWMSSHGRYIDSGATP